MPHATTPSPGFQALILCGPGVNLSTFTSSPKDFPKALIPIANRPMVWYALDWCYRMGITNIHLVTPPESEAALQAALSQNPHLTTLPTPKPDILAPQHLTHETSTAEVFRLPEVQAAVSQDFVVLPCDLVCELDGTALLESWMTLHAGFGGATGGLTDWGQMQPSIGGEKNGRRGGLGVFFSTKGEGSAKGEETDFIATTPIPAPAVPLPQSSLQTHISTLAFHLPTASLNDLTEGSNSLRIRYSLLKKHSRVRFQTTHRDAHVYFFPYWVLDLMKQNEKFESLGEDVLGWWAKAGWQDGLGDKLGMREILDPEHSSHSENANGIAGHLGEGIDIADLSTTRTITGRRHAATGGDQMSPTFASRVREAGLPTVNVSTFDVKSRLEMPPILAYVQPPNPQLPLIRRVDTAHLLLAVSLRLAKLPSVDEVGKASASPFAHQAKVAHPDTIPRQCRVEAENSLLAENVTVEEKTNVKESIIGPNCHIGSGARLIRCLLMEGAVVGENCQLSDCILGRRCKVEGGSRTDDAKTNLRNCEIQEGNVVPWGTDAKNEKFMIFEGLSEEGDSDSGFDDKLPSNDAEPEEG